MDVTAMLNSSPEATEQRRLEEPNTTPLRNRTPWDAGGYSLPFHIHHLGTFTDDAYPNDSLMDIDQPRHRFSDSHSSLSSFASSNSISHSRFSSMSTVSSLHLSSHTVPEAIFMDSETSSHSSNMAAESCSPISPQTGRSNSQASSSPALYGNDLGLVSERPFYKSPRKEFVDQSTTLAEVVKVNSTNHVEGGKGGGPSAAPPRPASPSDAILIKRTAPPVTPYLPQPTSLVDRDYSYSLVP
jgi:hypothetical protein